MKSSPFYHRTTLGYGHDVSTREFFATRMTGLKHTQPLDGKATPSVPQGLKDERPHGRPAWFNSLCQEMYYNQSFYAAVKYVEFAAPKNPRDGK
jgi:hypothetical protein